MKIRISSLLMIILLISFITGSVGAEGLNIQGNLTSELEVEKENEKLWSTNDLELDLSYYSSNSGLSKVIIELTDTGEEILNLKEAFAELYLEATDIKIGKQRIVWGKADGINPTDNFNPENLAEPFAEDNKIAVPAVRVRHYKQDWIFDLVWAPQFTAPEFAGPGDRWSTLPSGVIEPVLPVSKIKNTDFGIRASKWTPEIDYSVSIFRGFSKEPIFPGQPAAGDGELIWQPEFYRVTALGGDFARDFGSFVLRGEGAYFRPDDEYNDLKSPYYQVVFGVDRDLTDNMYLNIQYYREEEENEEAVQMLTLSTEYEITAFKNIELNGSYNIDDGDFLFNPVYKMDVMDGVTVSLGAYIFDGERGTGFGAYAEQDYGYIELQRNF